MHHLETHSGRPRPFARTVGKTIASLCVAAALTQSAGAQQPMPPAGGPPAAARPQPAPQMPRAAASTRATVEVLLSHRMIGGNWFNTSTASGPARIRIDYGQPHARGRAVMGSLVPMDSVWRLGANVSTQLTTDVDITIGNAFVPRGTYSLFALPGKTGWKLIVSKAVGEWGTDYDPSQDLARIDLRARSLTEPMESLSIFLIPTLDAPNSPPMLPKGVLRIVWERTELTADWKVGR